MKTGADMPLDFSLKTRILDKKQHFALQCSGNVMDNFSLTNHFP